MTEQTDAQKIAMLEKQVAELKSENINLEEAASAAFHNAPGALWNVQRLVGYLSDELKKRPQKIKPETVLKFLEDAQFFSELVATEIELGKLFLDQEDPEVRTTYIKSDLKNLVRGFQMRRNKKHDIRDALHLDIALKILEGVPERIDVARGVVLSAVSNFLSNAIKFSPMKTPIEVEIAFTPVGNEGELYVSVRDYGPGLKPGDEIQVFKDGKSVGLDDPQVKFRKRKGIGLQTADVLADRAGGKCWAESAGPGQGAKFWFRVPAYPLAAP